MITLQAPVPPDPVIWLFPGPHLPPAVAALIVLSVMAGVLVLCWPVGRAFARRIRSRGRPSSGMEQTVLHDRVSRLEDRQGRIVELEERLDFTERVLARDEATRAPR